MRVIRLNMGRARASSPGSRQRASQGLGQRWPVDRQRGTHFDRYVTVVLAGLGRQGLAVGNVEKSGNLTP
jgi:hypothetical protein